MYIPSGFWMTTQSLASTATNHTYINQLSKHVGQEVVLKGWLYNLRSSGKLLFPQLRDGTGVVQCVVLKNAVDPENFEALKQLGQESALVIKGTVREDSRAPGGYEIDVKRRFSGISICAAMAAFRMPDSAWASNAVPR